MSLLSAILMMQLSAANANSCGGLKTLYKEHACCADNADKAVPLGYAPKEGPMSSVMPAMAKAKLIMGMDVDYPPYAYLKKAPYGSSQDLDEVIGVGADMVKGMAAHCGFDVYVLQAHWSDCWGKGEIGKGLLQGWYHGCMTYTHAAGVRNRYMEFTNSWAIPNKPSGLIAKLTGGVPSFDGNSDLSGKTVADVTGWAPTSETLYFIKNQCTKTAFTGFTIVQGDDLTLDRAAEAKGANDRALLAVLEGKADAMFIYGDQAANYHCKADVTQEGWNCDIWNTFGTDFAYVQSGMFAWMHNGTTTAMSKKGSGVADFLDTCFESFRATKEFYNVCKTKHGSPPHSQLLTCIPNDHFASDPDYKALTVDHDPYMFGTDKHSGDCSNGYCPCPAPA
jgi:ABC-type amino acid transport substrate-binding protein